MRDPELVARAQRAATRLESAWEQWRAATCRIRSETWPSYPAGPPVSFPVR
jgi:hypothetical protein